MSENNQGSAGAAAGGTGNGNGEGAAAAAGGAAAAAAAAAGAGAAAAAAGAAAGSGAAAGAGAGAGAGAAAAGAGGAGAAAGDIWGGDWRESYAKGDDSRLNVLKRYTSPAAALDALFEAQGKIRSGQAKQALPENATPEQLTAYRKEHGIPETPEGYLANLPKEITVAEHDKEIITPYLSLMHKHNMAPAVAQEFLAARQHALDSMIEQRITEDKTMQAGTEEALRKDWGPEYQGNINSIHSMLDGAPPEVAEAFLNARTPDGAPLFGTAQAVRWFAGLARELNPFGAIVGPGGGALDGKGVEERLGEISRWMGAPAGSVDYKRYWNDSKVQAEYRSLLQAKERNAKRAA